MFNLLHMFIYLFEQICIQNGHICDSPGMLDEFGGLAKVMIDPTCVTLLQRAVVLALLVLGQIDAGWQVTQLT